MDQLLLFASSANSLKFRIKWKPYFKIRLRRAYVEIAVQEFHTYKSSCFPGERGMGWCAGTEGPSQEEEEGALGPPRLPQSQTRTASQRWAATATLSGNRGAERGAHPQEG